MEEDVIALANDIGAMGIGSEETLASKTHT